MLNIKLDFRPCATNETDEFFTLHLFFQCLKEFIECLVWIECLIE